MKRTYKVGDKVTLREMKHLVGKDCRNSFDNYAGMMLDDAISQREFTITKRCQDKWYIISSLSEASPLSWTARYNWIQPVEQEISEGKITQILWQAITYLQEDEIYNVKDSFEEYSSYYTCDCVSKATRLFGFNQDSLAVLSFLDSLGFKDDMSNYFNVFHDFPKGIERQGARFQWLHFAYWIAKEEGI